MFGLSQKSDVLAENNLHFNYPQCHNQKQIFQIRSHLKVTIDTQVSEEAQSAAKLFEYLQFFFGLIANFYNLVFVINSKKPKLHDLTNIYSKKLH